MSSVSIPPRFSQNNFKFPTLDFLTSANSINGSPFLAFSCKFRLPRLSLGSLDIDFTSSLLLVASPPSLPLGNTLDFSFGNCVPVWLVWLWTVPLNNSFLGIFQLFSGVLGGTVPPTLSEVAGVAAVSPILVTLVDGGTVPLLISGGTVLLLDLFLADVGDLVPLTGLGGTVPPSHKV